jgi:lipid-A-disaccharide synthase
MKKIFMVVGEASGDYLGGKLMDDIKSAVQYRGDKVEFGGIGGFCMEKAGIKKLFSINELSLIGIFEVVGKIFRIKKLINKTVEAILDYGPDVIVTIDSSGFTHRVDKAVKKRDPSIPVVHYVAPPVWAWRSWRAKSMHKFIDKLLVLLPFEPDIFNKYNLETVFVGHPVAYDADFNEPDEVAKNAFLQSIGVDQKYEKTDSNSAQKLRQKEDFSRISVSICGDVDNTASNIEEKQKIGPETESIPKTASIPRIETKIITILPGSRPSELEKHMPILSEFAALMAERYKNVKFLLPTIESLTPHLTNIVNDWPQKPLIITNKLEKVLAYYTSDMAVAASGTVALELARTGLPAVIIYKTTAVTSLIIKFLLNVKNVSLINILAKKQIVPELLQKNCTAKNIFDHALEILDADAEKKRQKESFSEIMKLLKVENPKLAAEEVLKKIYPPPAVQLCDDPRQSD